MRADLERKTRGEGRKDTKPKVKVKLPKLENEEVQSKPSRLGELLESIRYRDR